MLIKTGRPNIFTLLTTLLLGFNLLLGQVPFVCQDQAFGIMSGTNEFVNVIVSPSNSASNVSSVGFLGVNLNALGYRSTDNLIYGVDPDNHVLFQIDANADVYNLGALDLQNGLQFLAGAIHPDGQSFYVIGSNFGADEVLSRINLSSGNFEVQNIVMNGLTSIVDITFDPYSNKLFGYDSESRSVVTINPTTGGVSYFSELLADKEIQTLYFDAFGELWAYGSAIYGVASALFVINTATGVAEQRATGPPNPIADGTSCPFSVEMENRVEPAITFPCSEVEYILTLANRSGTSQTGIDFEHKLPTGCNYIDMLQNPFGGNVAPGTPSDLIKINGLTIPAGVDSMVFLVEVEDVPGGNYNSQAILTNLPSALGNIRYSDDPRSAVEYDSTKLKVNRIEEDSLFFTRFLCLGESIVLEGAPYGNNLTWSNGSTAQNLNVSHEGQYVLDAVSGCQTVVISYEVTTASCPYTIAMYHEIVPEEALACNEIIYRFIVENESGVERNNVSFSNFLDEGFSFVEFVKNPFGGELDQSLAPNEIMINDMTLPLGVDTLDILIAVGDVPTGEYKSRAKLFNLPPLIGMFRFSNDLNSSGSDSTILTILGLVDDLELDEVICAGESLVLDGRPYGLSFLWENGSIEDTIIVYEPGSYLLTLTGGCEPGYVHFNVEEGDPINVEISEPIAAVHLGDELRLAPYLFNGGDSLLLEWNDPLGNSIACSDCLETTALPINNTTYSIAVSNGVCSDSDSIVVIVDKERKIYVPNVFTPNFDGVNDHFFIQSPDFGIVKSLVILDRWGVAVFETENILLNEWSSGWDGQIKGNKSNAGVYIWQAEIEFLDGDTKVYTGDVTLIR